jgi:BirA family biotin operon repressor/biotin-[acetyl-CoA-carboxylase] ligase
VAVWQALYREYGLPVEIKWPNDLLLHRQKCAGILVEAAWTGTDLKGVVLGIGINISEGSLPPTEFQMFPATFLEAATANPVDRYRLLASIL